MGLSINFSLLLYTAFVFSNSYCLEYDVQWFSGATVIERDVPSKQTVNIYCYTGSPKSLLTLWQTVKFITRVKNNEFTQYLGSNPAEVFKGYKEDSYGWAVVSPFQRKPQKSVSLDLYEPSCMVISTKHKHTIELQIIRIDLWRIILMFVGITAIFSSRLLSGNPVFFYLCGIFIGVFASFMVLVYYVSKMLPKKTLTYGILIGGWTVGVYLFQQAYENIRTMLLNYHVYMFWYCLVVSLASFLICYRIGPPKNQRSKNIVMWTLQAAGILMIFLSSQYQEAAAAVIVISLIAKYFPKSLWYRILGYWRRRFPPRPKLLTNEEYYEQGARHTKEALDSLRKYCSSPDCKQWSIMLKLNDSKRFASFVEGNSHLSDDEVIDYESYAFSLERKPTPLRNSTRSSTRNSTRSSTRNMEISDDDSSIDDDL